MPKRERMPPDQAQAIQQLLIEGAQSYVDAATALIEYQGTIQKKCRAVLAKQHVAYGAALGVTLNEGDIQDYAWPEPGQWSGTDADLGVQIGDLPGPEGLSRWWSCCSLSWDYSDPAAHWFGVYVGIILPRKHATELHNKLRLAKTQDLYNDGELVWITSELGVQDATHFDKKLADLLIRWISACRKVGGLKSLLS